MTHTRDYRLDLIRGLALLVIYVDHVTNCWLRYFTPQGWQVCDFAEVFVFISGFSASVSYARQERSGIEAVAVRAVGRAWKLYRWYILTLAATLLTVRLALMAGLPPLGSTFLSFGQAPARYLMGALYFRNIPNVFSVLALYIGLLAAMPVMAWFSRRSLWKLVLLSVTVYVGSYLYVHWFPSAAAPGSIEAGDWTFKPLAWQLLFVLGYVWPRVRWPEWTRSRLLFGLGCGIVILCGILTLASLYSSDFHLRGTAKDSLGILRIVNFAGWILVIRPFWHALPKRSWLMTCGRHSLTVYCAGAWLSIVSALLIAAVHAGKIVQFGIVFCGVAGLVCLATTLARMRSRVPGRVPGATAPAVPASAQSPAPTG